MTVHFVDDHLLQTERPQSELDSKCKGHVCSDKRTVMRCMEYTQKIFPGSLACQKYSVNTYAGRKLTAGHKRVDVPSGMNVHGVYA